MEIDDSGVLPTQQELDHDWIGAFIEGLPEVRNAYAHGSDMRAMVSVFRALRRDTSDANLWNFGAASFAANLKEKATFLEEIDTESNLWPSVAKRINDSIGLQCTLFEAHDAELRQLVGRRNKIAHGEKLEIANLDQLQKFEHAAVLAMHDLAIAVVDSLDKKSYLGSTAAAAIAS